MINMKKQLSCVALFFLISGCASENLMRTWSTQEVYDSKFKNLMVMGLVNNVNLRNETESEVVRAARTTGILATNGMSMFPPELGKPFDDIEKVKTRLREKGYDGILTVALVDYRAPRYIKPETAYEPMVYYDRFRNYYYRTYELVYKPGYFAQESKFFVETNFYELKGGSLIWSGRSKLIEPIEFETFLPTYAKGLFKELMSQGIISK